MNDSERPRTFGRLAILGMVLALTGIASAQQPQPQPEKVEKKEEGPSSWLPVLRQQSADYEIVLRDNSKTTPRPLPDPILRWSQPVRGGDDGAVFLWVVDGRPAAVGTIFTYRTPGMPRAMQHEVHSLSTIPLDARWRGRAIWRADQPGLKFEPVLNAPKPADTGSARIRQMQAIAREFTASNVHETAGRNELRLMPKPLHRYGPTANDTVDGALFCFAHGTDPEAFLVVEARRKGSDSEYQYAFARFSDLALKARYKGKNVWEVPRGEWNRHDGIHAYYIVEQVEADTPDEYQKRSEGR